MPFVVVPGFAFAACSLIAALFVEPLWFLVAIGMGSAFEVAVRPGQTAIVRLAYPATYRGAAVGETRRWASLVFLISILASAFALRWSAEDTVAVIRLQLYLAGMLSLGSFLCFHKIRVNETDLAKLRKTRFDFRSHLVNLSTPLTRNARFRHYTFSCFLFGFFYLVYAPYLEAVLVHDLGLGYVGSAVLLHVAPSVLAFLTTGHFGHWIDRTSPWIIWGWIRFGWGLDPLILCAASAVAATTSSASIALATIGRACRGTTMGAS